eukprot:CAMPEP_0119008536 /NCGR_PEP_ID=MMETSP1176-20130426/3765_1 /TAXON_ID=265551 /ORGANISM="Synedropsis recta cf, Strain CCMP1620" /LENGTH=461 /DNA_ID=CAMNT_0006960887 /DNA_START=43 /DNA_END=1424 /DNA_ORIENTATION=+
MGFESSVSFAETATRIDPLSKSQRPSAKSPTTSGPTSPTSVSNTTVSMERRMPSPSVSSQRVISDQLETNGELVCDYDSSPSTLYSLLEASNWELAVTRAKTHPNEVRTWVVRRDKGTKDIRWKLLPIHAAVIFQSPKHVVETILDKYPAAIQRKDDQGMIPLHLAFRHKKADEDLLQFLLIHHPKGVHKQDSRGRTPLELGRDGIFSAKFMSLYTSTCVALSSHSFSVDAASVATKEYETNLQKTNAEYELQINRLTSIYEERIAMIEQTNQIKLDQQKQEARNEKDALVNVHHEEMQALHHVVTSQNSASNSNRQDKLNVEIQQLQSEVNRFKNESKRLNTKMKSNNAFSLDFKEQILALSQDQTKLQTLVERQQEELEAAQSMRTQLLRTLLQQEELDAPNLAKSSHEIQHLMKAINTRIDTVADKVTDGDDIDGAQNGDKYQEYVQAKHIEDDEISA